MTKPSEPLSAGTHYEIEQFKGTSSGKAQWIAMQPWRYATLAEAARALSKMSAGGRIVRCEKTVCDYPAMPTL